MSSVVMRLHSKHILHLSSLCILWVLSEHGAPRKIY